MDNILTMNLADYYKHEFQILSMNGTNITDTNIMTLGNVKQKDIFTIITNRLKQIVLNVENERMNVLTLTDKKIYTIINKHKFWYNELVCLKNKCIKEFQIKTKKKRLKISDIFKSKINKMQEYQYLLENMITNNENILISRIENNLIETWTSETLVIWLLLACVLEQSFFNEENSILLHKLIKKIIQNKMNGYQFCNLSLYDLKTYYKINNELFLKNFTKFKMLRQSTIQARSDNTNPDKSKRKCIICRDNSPKYAFDCYHFCVCAICVIKTIKLTNESDYFKCYYCRKTVSILRKIIDVSYS